MAIYNNIYVVLDGQLLAESVSVETSLKKQTSPVFSITGNFEGVSVGPMIRSISVNNVIPANGSEVQFEELMKTNKQVEIMLQEGSTGRLCISRGHITGVSRRGSVGASGSISFEFIGSASTFA